MRRFFVMLLCLLLFCSVCIPVSAHKGKTDGSGGHKDRSTGDYHYHHGYPAHDHYDMDGDGKIDCPYDFDDQTNHQIGNSSYRESSDHSTFFTEKTIPTNPPTETAAIAESELTKKEEAKIVPVWCFLPLIAIILFQWVSIRQKKDDINYWRSKNQKDKEIITNEYEAKLKQQKHEHDVHIAASGSLESIRSRIVSAKNEYENVRLQLSKEQKLLIDARAERRCLKIAPLDISFSEDGMPIYWKHNYEKPYGDYTVYMSPKSQVYHTKQFCTSYHPKTEHIFNVIDLARPCKKCAEGYFDFTTVPDWYRTSNEQISIFDN